MARATTKAATPKAKAAPPARSTAKGSGKAETEVPAKTTRSAASLPPTKALTKGGKKAAAPPPPTKPAKAPVVTLKHLAAGISERRGMPKREAEAFAAELIGDLLARVKEGARVKVAGLGILEIKDRPARTARNPATGEPVQVAPSRKVAFRPAKELKGAV